MKEQNAIDQAIKERLHNATVPPPAFVWDGVERELHKKRRKRIVFWWSWAGIAALLVVGGTWYAAQKTTNSTASAPTASPLTGTEQPPNLPSVNQYEAQGTPHQSSIAAKPTQIQAQPFAKSNAHTSPDKPAKNSVKGLPYDGVIAAPTGPAAVAVPETDAQPVEPQAKATGTPLPLGVLPSLKGQALVPKKMPFEVDKCTGTLTQKSRSLDDRGTAWMVDGYAGPLFAHDQLSASSSNLETLTYLQERKSTEGPGWGFNGGVRANYLFKRHFIVGAGINYHQYTSVFRYKDPLHLVYSTENNGIDTIDATFGIKTVTAYNRFNYLDLPFHLGYEWRKGRFGLQLRGGMAFNVWFHNKGTMLHPNTLQPVAFGVPNATIVPFRSTVGWSVQSSAQAFWHIRPQMRLFVEPYYQSPVHLISHETAPVQQRSRWIGIRMGATSIF